MSGQGPYWGQLGWFTKFHHEKLPSAIDRYLKEVRRTIGVIDSHLARQGTPYLVGERATYADIMFLPWIRVLRIAVPEFNKSQWEDMTYYRAWVDRMYARPAIVKALKVWDADMHAKIEAEKPTGPANEQG